MKDLLSTLIAFLCLSLESHQIPLSQLHTHSPTHLLAHHTHTHTLTHTPHTHPHTTHTPHTHTHTHALTHTPHTHTHSLTHTPHTYTHTLTPTHTKHTHTFLFRSSRFCLSDNFMNAKIQPNLWKNILVARSQWRIQVTSVSFNETLVQLD